MKIIGLNKKEYAWNLTQARKESQSASSLHIRARSILKNQFPFDVIYEELELPGIITERQNSPLFADFYIHSRRLMIEVQGEQHYKFNSFFFKNKIEFLKSQYRDNLKSSWCKLNSITLIYFPYNETDQQWLERIYNRYNDNDG